MAPGSESYECTFNEKLLCVRGALCSRSHIPEVKHLPWVMFHQNEALLGFLYKMGKDMEKVKSKIRTLSGSVGKVLADNKSIKHELSETCNPRNPNSGAGMLYQLVEERLNNIVEEIKQGVHGFIETEKRNSNTSVLSGNLYRPSNPRCHPKRTGAVKLPSLKTKIKSLAPLQIKPHEKKLLNKPQTISQDFEMMVDGSDSFSLKESSPIHNSLTKQVDAILDRSNNKSGEETSLSSRLIRHSNPKSSPRSLGVGRKTSRQPTFSTMSHKSGAIKKVFYQPQNQEESEDASVSSENTNAELKEVVFQIQDHLKTLGRPLISGPTRLTTGRSTSLANTPDNSPVHLNLSQRSHIVASQEDYIQTFIRGSSNKSPTMKK